MELVQKQFENIMKSKQSSCFAEGQEEEGEQDKPFFILDDQALKDVSKHIDTILDLNASNGSTNAGSSDTTDSKSTSSIIPKIQIQFLNQILNSQFLDQAEMLIVKLLPNVIKEQLEIAQREIIPSTDKIGVIVGKYLFSMLNFILRYSRRCVSEGIWSGSARPGMQWLQTIESIWKRVPSAAPNPAQDRQR